MHKLHECTTVTTVNAVNASEHVRNTTDRHTVLGDADDGSVCAHVPHPPRVSPLSIALPDQKSRRQHK